MVSIRPIQGVYRMDNSADLMDAERQWAWILSRREPKEVDLAILFEK
jgi:hypothetical protein